MLLGFVLLFGFGFVVWLVFFQFKWLKFSIPWAVVSALFGAHLLIIFMLGLRFVTPVSTDAVVIQHTIQLTPRLSEPTLVTAVLVEPNVPVKKGQPLFQFDRTIYAAKVRQLEAQLAQAKQNVLVLKANTQVSTQKAAKLGYQLKYAKYQAKLSGGLAKQGAGPNEDVQKWQAQAGADAAGIREALAEQAVAELQSQSQIDGVNTTVAEVEAELAQARYYLGNTTMLAPADGYLINLQVRPGMVAGDVRFGAIATFIVDDGRYVLAKFFQENLKYVKPGQPVELAMDLYPGQIFKGTVQEIWKGSGQGQMLPSGVLPDFQYKSAQLPQGQFALAIHIDEKDQSMFPLGTQGRAAVYTNPHSSFRVLRKVAIRSYSWFNWLYPFSG